MAPSRSVRKAVIPAAGKGTRMNVVSEGAPKELLTVGDTPAIRFALEETVAGGIDRIAVVISPEKTGIQEYIDEAVRRGELGTQVTYILQQEQRGLGDAVTLCRDFTGDEPFALLLPDNVFLSPEYDFGRLVALHRETDRDVIGVVELDEVHSGRFGNCGLIDFEILRPGVLDIQRLRDKQPGGLEIAPRERITRTCGRYICRPHVFDYLEQSRPPEGELDEVPAYQRIIAEKGAVGCLLPGPLFDVGNPAGYVAANAYVT